jgi:hypothetical protein
MARTREQLKNPITLSDLKAQQGFKDQKVPDTMPKGPVLKDKTEQYKAPTERGMERLRQQLENPKKIDLSQFEKPQNNTDNEKGCAKWHSLFYNNIAHTGLSPSTKPPLPV